MAEKITNIAKNTSYFTLALILQKVISFSYFTILARALGPEDLGKYYLAISFTAIFAIFIDLGLSNVLTREIARDKQMTGKLLGTVIGLKLPLALLTVLLIFFIVNIRHFGYPQITIYLVYISTIAVVLDSFTSTFFAVLRGHHNLKFESIASVIFQIIVLLFGLAVLKLDMGLLWQMTALTIASTFNFIYSISLIAWKIKVKLRPVYEIASIKMMVGIALPFATYGIFQKLYTYFDTVLLSILAGDKYVGIYQISFKIIFALQFLPLAFTASLYPALSTYWANNREQLRVTFERAMNYLIIISFPIAFGIIVVADKIILLFKSGYDEALLPLQITMGGLLFLFLGYPVGSLLNACDKQKINTINMSITVFVSIILNLFLIKNYEAVGASITVAVTNLLMFSLGFYQVPKILGMWPSGIWQVLLKALLATLVMASTALFLKSYLNIFIVVIIAGSIYLSLLYMLGGFKKEDIVSIYKSFRKAA